MDGRGIDTITGRCAPRRGGLAILGFVLVAVLSGCIGPQAIKQTRLPYNAAYRQTTDEQLLLNIVRLRYAEAPSFLELPSITSQFEIQGRGSYSAGLDGQGPGRTNLGLGEMAYRDSPTLSYQPKKGSQFARALARPIDAELIRLVLGTTNIAPFLLLAVNDANDVSNAPQATAMIPDRPADNLEYRELVGLVAELYRQDALELAVDTVEVPTSDAVPAYGVHGQDVLDAARVDYVFRVKDGERLMLKKRQKSIALKVRPGAENAPELQELTTRLKLTPGLPLYRLRSELLNDDDDADDFGELPNALGDDTIFLNMRSTLEVMVFLSKGVCLPPDHIASGEAPTTRDALGQPFDWTHVTAGLFRVRSGPKRPKDAEVAVPYRDHWYWIERGDAASRATLSTLELLFALQESDEQESGPLLTLPIGG